MLKRRGMLAAPITLVVLFATVLIGLSVVIAASSIHKSGNLSRTITPPSTEELIQVSDARLDPNDIATENNDVNLTDYDAKTVYFVVTNISGKDVDVIANCAASSGVSIAFVDTASSLQTFSMAAAEEKVIAVIMQFTASETVTSGSYSVDFSATLA